MRLIPLNDCSSYKEINTNNETGKESVQKRYGFLLREIINGKSNE